MNNNKVPGIELFSSSSHSDGFARSPAGPPHYYHSTAGSRKLVGQTTNGNATTSPTEGTVANTVSDQISVHTSLCAFICCYVLFAACPLHYSALTLNCILPSFPSIH